jgi:hypothetical protein
MYLTTALRCHVLATTLLWLGGVLAVVGFVVSPVADDGSAKPGPQSRARWGGRSASVLTIGIAILMVLRPDWG